MANKNAPETYSNDDKQKNEVFALPLVGKRRKAYEARLFQVNNQQQKRPHLQPNSVKKEARESDLTNLEMRRTNSALPVGGKSFAALF